MPQGRSQLPGHHSGYCSVEDNEQMTITLKTSLCEQHQSTGDANFPSIPFQEFMKSKNPWNLASTVGSRVRLYDCKNPGFNFLISFIMSEKIKLTELLLNEKRYSYQTNQVLNGVFFTSEFLVYEVHTTFSFLLCSKGVYCFCPPNNNKIMAILTENKFCNCL